MTENKRQQLSSLWKTKKKLYLKPNLTNNSSFPFHKHHKHLRLFLYIFLIFVFIFSTIILFTNYMQDVKEEQALKNLVTAMNNIRSPTKSPNSTSLPNTTNPQAEHPLMLEQYRKLYEQNQDMIGWIKIDGTRINYPVMYTKDDFYLHHGFNKEKSKNGVPFIDKRCLVDPLGTNTIIYGHNMKNGKMFSELIRYKDIDYYRKHPIIKFDTLYKKQKYEIIAVFESQVYRKNDKVFKHYNFLNAINEEHFKEYIEGIKALSLYNTAITAQYGDELITLMTCSYHTENGRLVVVARKIPQSE